MQKLLSVCIFNVIFLVGCSSGEFIDRQMEDSLKEELKTHLGSYSSDKVIQCVTNKIGKDKNLSELIINHSSFKEKEIKKFISNAQKCDKSNTNVCIVKNNLEKYKEYVVNKKLGYIELPSGENDNEVEIWLKCTTESYENWLREGIKIYIEVTNYKGDVSSKKTTCAKKNVDEMPIEKIYGHLVKNVNEPERGFLYVMAEALCL